MRRRAAPHHLPRLVRAAAAHAHPAEEGAEGGDVDPARRELLVGARQEGRRAEPDEVACRARREEGWPKEGRPKEGMGRGGAQAERGERRAGRRRGWGGEGRRQSGLSPSPARCRFADDPSCCHPLPSRKSDVAYRSQPHPRVIHGCGGRRQRWAGQGRAAQRWAGQGRAGQGRAGEGVCRRREVRVREGGARLAAEGADPLEHLCRPSLHRKPPRVDSAAAVALSAGQPRRPAPRAQPASRARTRRCCCESGGRREASADEAAAAAAASGRATLRSPPAAADPPRFESRRRRAGRRRRRRRVCRRGREAGRLPRAPPEASAGGEVGLVATPSPPER